MYLLKVLRHPDTSWLTLKTLHLFDYYWNTEALSAQDIADGLSEGILDNYWLNIYDSEQLKDEGVYCLLDDNGRILWQNLQLPDKLRENGIMFGQRHFSSRGNLIFRAEFFSHENSRIPSLFQPGNLKEVELTLCRSYEESDFKQLTIALEWGTFHVDDLTEVCINSDFTLLKVSDDHYTYFFSIVNNQEFTTLPLNENHDSLEKTKQRRNEKEAQLRSNIKQNRQKLEALLDEISGHTYEDSIYRFYYQSFKIYSLQNETKKIVRAIQQLLPDQPAHPWFSKIVQEGINRKFTLDCNNYWLEDTLPITTAFFHAKFILEMIVKYGTSSDEEKSGLPSGWAAVLTFSHIR